MSILTNLETKLLSISPELEDVVAGLQVVQSATQLGGSSASTGLAIIAAVLKSLDAKVAGALTHTDFLAQIAQAAADLKADRTAEDAELAALKPAPLPT